jgi:hypothetical protein
MSFLSVKKKEKKKKRKPPPKKTMVLRGDGNTWILGNI